ncbi:MAG: PIN domain-containing protein [Nocardioidaceae bacterium]|nr:MAG: PIN domain-containing protein [Nocardioidaceae bacterium]
MIVLDTNVVSEAMRPQPNLAVVGWLNAQAAGSMFLVSVTLAELLSGIGALPAAARRTRLEKALDGLPSQRETTSISQIPVLT